MCLPRAKKCQVLKRGGVQTYDASYSCPPGGAGGGGSRAAGAPTGENKGVFHFAARGSGAPEIVPTGCGRGVILHSLGNHSEIQNVLQHVEGI